jgi:hypothetical protein
MFYGMVLCGPPMAEAGRSRSLGGINPELGDPQTWAKTFLDHIQADYSERRDKFSLNNRGPES